MFRFQTLTLGALCLGASLLLTAGCGGAGGGGFFDPLGTVEVNNATAFDAVTFFELSPAGSGGGTGDLIGHPLFPGESADVGDFFEDYYDVEYDLNGGATFVDFDFFVAGGFINAYDVF